MTTNRTFSNVFLLKSEAEKLFKRTDESKSESNEFEVGLKALCNVEDFFNTIKSAKMALSKLIITKLMLDSKREFFEVDRFPEQDNFPATMNNLLPAIELDDEQLSVVAAGANNYRLPVDVLKVLLVQGIVLLFAC